MSNKVNLSYTLPGGMRGGCTAELRSGGNAPLNYFVWDGDDLSQAPVGSELTDFREQHTLRRDLSRASMAPLPASITTTTCERVRVKEVTDLDRKKLVELEPLAEVKTEHPS